MILTKFFDACHQWPMGLSSSFAAVINCSSWPMSSKPFVSWFSCRWHGHKPVKKMAISMAAAIEKLRLFADQGGFSLAMSVDSDTHRVNSPGTPPGGNHLLPTHCETIHLSCCEPRWHGLYARHQPRSALLTGVSFSQAAPWQIRSVWWSIYWPA